MEGEKHFASVPWFRRITAMVSIGFPRAAPAPSQTEWICEGAFSRHRPMREASLSNFGKGSEGMKKFALLAALWLTACWAIPAGAAAGEGVAGGLSPVYSPEEPEADTLYHIHYTYRTELISNYYHLYGSVLDDFAIIEITNRSGGAALFLVETLVEGYSWTARETILVQAGQQGEIRQNPRLVPEALEKLNAQRYANFVIRVSLPGPGGEELLLYDSNEILLYSRRDYTWLEGLDRQENWDLLAVYVTPNDPAVEELLRRAANHTQSGQMTGGYGGRLRDEGGSVWERLEAIWKAEEDLQLTYVSTLVSFSPESIQRIRLPYEVLEQSGGNCIELAILYASAVEAIRLEAAVVLVPGHAYLAVRTDEVNKQYYFVETTMIGQTEFARAVSYGAESYRDDGPKIDAGDEEYNWVTVKDAREQGILPVPWR